MHLAGGDLHVELDPADLLGRAGQMCATVRIQLDVEVATCEVHGDRALAPAVRDRSGSTGDGARAGGKRLPRPALPDSDAELVIAVDPHELDVRALGKTWMVLDQRSELQQVGAVGFPPDDRMWIPDRDRRELDLFA